MDQVHDDDHDRRGRGDGDADQIVAVLKEEGEAAFENPDIEELFGAPPL